MVLFLMSNNSLFHCMDLAETKKEFIMRTQNLPFSKKYTHPLSKYFIEPRGAGVGYYVTCPYNKHFALLRPVEEKSKSQLVIVNAELDVYARQFLNYKKIIAIALASKLDIFATIHEKQGDTTDILKIRRIDTKETIKKFVLPKTFEIASAFNAHPGIAFNKQGTDIIVWGVDSTQRSSYKGSAYGTPALDYMIFSFEEVKSENP